MTLQVLLIAPTGHGGEGIYLETLRTQPPPDVSYDVAAGFHSSSRGAKCLYPLEVALNRIVRPATIPDMGIRALRLHERYDLVHAHAHPTSLWGLGDTPLVMSEGSSSAVYLGDYLGWTRQRIATSYARSQRIYRTLGIHDRLLTMERAARVYVFSEWARRINVGWGADPEKLDVIYPGFATPAAATPSSEARFTFLFVGTDFERKGGHDVIDAYDRIAVDIPDVHLVIAGFDPRTPNPDLQLHSWVSDARRERVARKIAELERRDRLTQYPHVSYELLRTELFPAAHAVVMPTHAEGFGFTNVEAMSFGLPVITSTVGPSAEIVIDGETGLLVPAGDVDALAAAMAALAASRDYASHLGAAARERFMRLFTLDRFRCDLGAFYERALAAL